MGSGVSSVALGSFALGGSKKNQTNHEADWMVVGHRGSGMKAAMPLDKWLNHPFPHLISGSKDNHGCTDLR